MGNYSGSLNDVYKKYIDEDFYKNAKEASLKAYAYFTGKDADRKPFVVPDYGKTLRF
jgi:hypothetical protein